MAESFVFHDPSGKRWTRVRHALRVGTVVLVIFAAVLTLAILTAPQVPALGLGSVAHVTNSEEVRSIIAGEHPAKNVPFGVSKRRNFVRSSDPVIHYKIAARVRDDQPLV